MRSLSHVVCLVVALGSVAVAAWQPEVAPDRAEIASPETGLKRVDRDLPQPIDRAISSAPLLRT